MSDTAETKPQELQAKPSVLRATIQIKRAATGKVEEYTLTGTPVAPKPELKKD